MDIQKPTDGELAALLSEHAHRYPEKARFTVVDGENDVALPVLLGNPSGASKLPMGKTASPAWDTTAAATFKMRPDTEAVTEQLVADCVLWPDAATWASWTRRWPALPEIVQVAVRRKTGSSLAMIEDFPDDAEKPEPIRHALERFHGSVVKRFKPTDKDVIDAVIMPPDAGLWRIFGDAMKKRGAGAGKLARDLAAACLTVAMRSDGSAVTADDLFDRWPGQALLVGLVVSHLAGITARFELGEW